jgi:class 3 adenylate cyclase/predicted ATPase
MTDIAGWLESLGMGQYAHVFAANDIDFEALLQLTDSDLQSIGLSLGHRRRLQAAIALLSKQSEPEAPASPESAGGTPNAAERRQLTIMFCDLVGSTALAGRLDPEDMNEVLGAYHALVGEEVARVEGFIARYMGDGVLVLFGYPQAHEDDAERAIRAGLALVDRIARLETVAGKLEMRIGVATGLVVVGDLIGSGAARDRSVVGETPNLAARLQSLGTANCVLISDATRQLVGDLFEYRDLGGVALKGFGRPISVWQVLRPSSVASRFEALRPSKLSPLVGRDEETELLLRRWRQASTGEGRVVLLSGEPGIGKSRLVRVLTERLAESVHRRIEWRCSSYHQNSAFYPVVEDLHRWLRFERDDSPGEMLHKLEAAMEQCGFDLSATVPLLGALLSLSLPERYRSPTMAPERQKQRTLETLVASIRIQADRQPTLLIVEDLHWVDPSTLELLGLLIEQIASARLLMTVTFRPEFRPPWPMLAHMTQLTVGRLARRDVEVFVENLTGGRTLPIEMRQQLIARSDGVPLFVEELTKALFESELVIPATLHDSLTARLDRLGTAKQIAQLGATLGREFDYELIQAVSPIDESALRQALTRLVDAELLYQRGVAPQSRYVFKHALIQDAAYESLLKTTRQQYHRQIARALEARRDDARSAPPELLAHHYTEAGLLEQALPYWQLAGEQAVLRSANVEAISHLTRALEVLKPLPDAPERARRELALQVALGVPLRAAKGFAAPEVGQAYARARELCHPSDTTELFSILRSLWEFSELRGEYQIGLELARQLLSLAERGQDRTDLLVAHEVMGDMQFWLGDFRLAREHTERAFALYDVQSHDLHVSRYGYDLGVASLCFGAWALWFLGYPEQALRSAQDAVSLARTLGHPFTFAFALLFAGQLHSYRREAEPTRELVEEAITISKERDFPMLLHQGSMIRGWALADQGQAAEAIALIHQGMGAWKAMGQELENSHFLGLIAEAYGRDGRPDQGLEVITQALSFADTIGEGFWEAELHRLRGELLLETSTSSRFIAAEESFRKAVAVADARGAKALELRAATSLGRLLVGHGKREEARRLVRDISGWFSEGSETPDLSDARKFLHGLT